MKKNNGITLISLIIIMTILFIITGIGLYTAEDREKINNINKMYNDIDLLNDKVSLYYIKYGGLPILRDSSNNGIIYDFSAIDFSVNKNDDSTYYIVDLLVLGDVTLNYGKEGFENPNASDDVYIINNKTHEIYYARGIESMGGGIYHSRIEYTDNLEDNIPPTKPEIKILSGAKNEEGVYTTAVSIEFVSGKDNGSGIEKTTYSVNDEEEKLTSILPNNTLTIEENGTYNIKARSYDMANNISDKTEIDITIKNSDKFFITKWNVKDDTGDTTVVLPVNINSTYDAKIHWGDGTSTVLQHNPKGVKLSDAELIDRVTHTYGENEDTVKTIEIEGIYTDFRMGTSTSTPTKTKLTSLEQWGNIGLTTINFKDCTNLSGIIPKPNIENAFEKGTSFLQCFYNTGIQSLEEGFALPNNIAGLNAIANMFNGCKKLESIPDSFKIPPRVTGTQGLFAYCEALEKLPEDFNINSNIANMGSMFYQCKSLKKLPTNFYIPSGCTNVSNIVSYCTNLEELPVGFILPENYTGTLQNFFRGCDSLKTLPDGFTIPKGVTNVKYMCMGSGIESLPDSFSIPENYTGAINHMFYLCSSLQKIPDNFKIPAGVTNISCLFRSNEKLKGSITILGNPETYDTCFSNTAIESGGTLTVNYSKNCTNIDAILKTGNANYVVKGEQID